MKKTVRASIAGCGFAASFHFECLQRVYGTNVEITGVHSPVPEEVKAFAAERGIPVRNSLEELLDNTDVVHVCTPPQTHEMIAVEALKRDVFPIVEKPFTGYFGDGSDDFCADSLSRQVALDGALASIQRMLDAESDSDARILYAENWVYAPSIVKEREIIEKTGAHILWIHGEESHSGSHSKTYGLWRASGGGAMMGKGCHPLTAAMYLKRIEGITRDGRPIRPAAVSARVHSVTRGPNYIDEGHLRTDYFDVEDFAMMHVVFDDGSLADIFSTELVMGGVHNWLEVSANNHRTVCNINPNTSMQTFNPVEENFKDIYLVEKISSKQGWSNPSPDEDWFTGYPQELEAFYRTVAYGDPLQSDSSLAADTISAIYSGYLSAENMGRETAVKTF